MTMLDLVVGDKVRYKDPTNKEKRAYWKTLNTEWVIDNVLVVINTPGVEWPCIWLTSAYDFKNTQEILLSQDLFEKVEES